ncbi:MAG TPA: DUF5009 domain-containing protein [Phycisphaerae bacterium]|nr:DUF5009 domain-containing protein [Phycisphaerae bacterium]
MSDQPSQVDFSSTTERVLSIDVFRGLTMLVMIFANNLDMAGIREVPNWLKHAVYAIPTIPADKVDHITFVDVIAPAFLFIVGAAIPLAHRARQQRGETVAGFLLHVVIRAAGLMIMGVYIGNMRSKNVCPEVVSHATWSVLMLLSLTMVWNSYPKAAGWRRGLFVAMRVAGLGVLIWLAVIYHRQDNDRLLAFNHRAWHVVGTIGWTYLVASLVYVVFRRQMAGVAACVGLLVLLWMADKGGALNRVYVLTVIDRYISLGSLIGANGAIAVAGVLVGMLFADDSPARSHGRRIRWILAMGMIAFLAGLMLQPIYGLSKPRTTPSWIFYSVTICCVSYVLLYWLIDARGRRRWTWFALPAGRNPLVAYFLHYLIHPLSIVLGIVWLNDHLNVGWPGIARTLGVTVVLGVLLTEVLTRLKVRVRL